MRDVRLDYAAEIRGERKRDGRPGRTQAIRAESLARPRAAALAAEVERLEVEARRANATGRVDPSGLLVVEAVVAAEGQGGRMTAAGLARHVHALDHAGALAVVRLLRRAGLVRLVARTNSGRRRANDPLAEVWQLTAKEDA